MAERVINLTVEGMTCGNCIRRIEQALYEIEGVVSAKADLATQKATVKLLDGDVNISLMTEKAVVSYVPGLATMQDFKEAVAKTGKRVTDPEELKRNNPVRQYMVNSGTPRGGCCS